MSYVKPKIAREKLGVRNETLRSWANEGRIKYIEGRSGHKLYDVDSYIKTETKGDINTKKKFIYCRVFSENEKNELERQVNYLKQKYPKHEILKEIGSSLNFKRKVFSRLLDRVIKNEVEEVVVAHKDRFCRFGWSHFEWLFKEFGVSLLVDSKEDDFTTDTELAEDLMSITHVFSSRHYSKRRRSVKNRNDKNSQENTEKENSSSDEKE